MARVYCHPYHYYSSYFCFQWQPPSLLLLLLLSFFVLAGARSSTSGSSSSSSRLVPPGDVQDLERGILISTYAAAGLGSVIASPPLLLCPIEQLVAAAEEKMEGEEHVEKQQQQPERRWGQEDEQELEEGESQGDDDRTAAAATTSWPSGETRRRKRNDTSSVLRTSSSQQQQEGEGKRGDSHHNKNDDKAGEKEEGWIKAGRGTCYETPVVVPGSHHQLFCAYARPSFQDGFGISIITTPETFARILDMDLPIFKETTGDGTRNLGKDSSSSFPQERQPPPPAYYAVPVPGKGIGMRAMRPISTNEVYMARTPAVMVDDGAVQALGVARLTALMVAAMEALPGRHRDDFLALTTHEHVNTLEERVYAIFDKNNFVTNWDGVGAFHSTFTHGR